jgi:hypothetical protein
MVVLVQPDDGLVRLDGFSGARHTVQNKVRAEFEERSVLAAQRFTFRTVRDHRLRRRGGTGGGPLDRRGEMRAAPPTEGSFLEIVDKPMPGRASRI